MPDTLTDQSIADLMAEAAAINWDDPDAIAGAGQALLAELSRPAVLRRLLNRLAESPQLWPMCEREYGLTKFVLHADIEDRFRLRLHILQSQSTETPHSHRMNFVTRLLCGSYVQRIYTPEDHGTELVQPQLLRCVARHTVGANQGYALGHSLVHALEITDGPVISLMLRGRSIKERALNIDKAAGKVWWQRTDKQPANESVAKLDVPAEMAILNDLLKQRNLI